ncbi:MAG: EamA family transporter [Candidatus Micrarchaeota archaeon]|nr:EamA family transporter [Candidatus Micrarchaeota archaeon]
MNIYLVIFLTLVAALITSYCQLLFKRGLSKKLNSIMDILNTLRNRYIIIGLGGYVLSFTLYLIALSGSQLSIVFPVFASSFIFVTIISAISLKERVSMPRIIGILLIFLGIVMVTITA